MDIRHFDIRAVLDRILVKMSVLAEQKKLELVSEVSANIPTLMPGDPLRIEQILINLINNAIKFTDYGVVSFRVFTDEQDFWGIEVRDTGFGIPDEMKLTIVEPFSQVDSSETRPHGGTGLGLSIVHELTTMMGGRINLDSKKGEGSTFTVYLPIDTKEVINE